MPGNSQRRGAVRKTGSKKGQTVGSGGQKPKRLQGKGPTPKATERPKHPAARKAAAATRRSAVGRPPGSRRPRRRPAGKSATSEWVFGRNAVVEALRAGVPVTTMYVASRIDSDDRVREALKSAVAQGFPLIEVQRAELDRMSDGGVHQGLAIQVPAYEYAHPHDLLARPPRPASRRSSWRSTESPTRETSVRSSARRGRSAAMVCSCPSGGRPG